MKRIFIAINVNSEPSFQMMLKSLKTELKNELIKWTPSSNIHITLAFLGDTEEKMIKALIPMLKVKCETTGNFELTLKGLGVFKNSDDPRIIWTGIEQCEKLIDLNSRVVESLKNLDIRIENRPFTPHLTLGRVKKIERKDKLRMLIEHFNNQEIQKVPVNEIIVYESVLLPQGPLYKPLSVIKLC
jgi:RNA 2',3'-cyclic 3'-phosphodiesterase